MSFKARVKVSVLLEYDCGQPWGDESQLGQLRRQARDEALEQSKRFVEAARSAGFRIEQLHVDETLVVIVPERV